MKRTEELEGAISRRLAKYCEAGLSDDSLQQPIHHANDPASDSEIITFQEPEKSLHSESESTAPGKIIGAIPPRISVTRQEEGFILERLQKAEVENTALGSLLSLARISSALAKRPWSMFQLTLSQSTKTGFAPRKDIGAALPMKVRVEVSTSSPAPTPTNRRARCNAAVPLDIAAA